MPSRPRQLGTEGIAAKDKVMKPEAQRIAITEIMREHCKCRNVGNERACNWNCPCGNSVMSGVCKNCHRDYLNDLNASHMAEKVLQDKGLYWPNYIDELSKMFRVGFPDKDATNWSQMAHATAAQRAEAFLRTIGKWQDDLPN